VEDEMRPILLLLIISLISLPVFAAENTAQWEGPYVLSMAKQNPTVENRLYNHLQSVNNDEKIPVWV
jgi:hypothetical protein